MSRPLTVRGRLHESLSVQIGEHGQPWAHSGLNKPPMSRVGYHHAMGRPSPAAGLRVRALGDISRRLGLLIPGSVRETRLALRLTQTQVGQRCGLSQPQISWLERGDLTRVTVHELGRLLDALGIRLDIELQRPFVAAPPLQQDAGHARALAYVGGRIRPMGWEVRLEVEIAEGRARGWIDLLAYRPDSRALFVGEIKAGLDDMGAAQRQLGWYERAARDVARSLGWRVEQSASALLVLATEANDRLITANHGLIRQAFPVRAARIFDWLVDPRTPMNGTAIALIDPRSRRRQWPIATSLDGRRTPLRYASYADFMRRIRAA
jgi:transcriptional regulator with XRE-family HTH domain